MQATKYTQNMPNWAQFMCINGRCTYNFFFSLMILYKFLGLSFYSITFDNGSMCGCCLVCVFFFLSFIWFGNVVAVTVLILKVIDLDLDSGNFTFCLNIFIDF